MAETEAKKVLVKLLSRELALFQPLRQRDWSDPHTTAARWELQRDFRTKGLPWTAGGDGSARKATEVLTNELRKVGLVATAGRTKGRRVKLTDRGRVVAEALADAPTRAEGWREVVVLLQFAKAGKLVSELLPAGLKNYSDADYRTKLSDLQFAILPAVVAGWVETFSDIHGRVAYRVTLAGEAAAQEPQPPTSSIAPDAAMDALFWAEYVAERDRLRQAQPSHESEIGAIPLSAGAWGEVAGPWSEEAR